MSQANYAKELTEVSQSMVRIETKLDNVLSVVGDHEARIRVAEAVIVADTERKREYVSLKETVANQNSIVESLSQTVDSWRRVVWIIGTAAFSGLGLMLWEIFKRGMNL